MPVTPQRSASVVDRLVRRSPKVEATFGGLREIRARCVIRIVGPSPRTASPVPPSSLPWMSSPYRSACNPPCSVPKRSRGPGSSPQPFDLLGQDAGEVLPALLVAAAHLVVGESV